MAQFSPDEQVPQQVHIPSVLVVVWNRFDMSHQRETKVDETVWYEDLTECNGIGKLLD